MEGGRREGKRGKGERTRQGMEMRCQGWERQTQRERDRERERERERERLQDPSSWDKRSRGP